MSGARPAPWSVEVHELSEGYSAIVYDARGDAIADHLDEATANLIAANPELFEALKPFASAYEDQGDGDKWEDRCNLWEHPAALDLTIGDLRRASAALAKALGTTLQPTREDGGES